MPHITAYITKNVFQTLDMHGFLPGIVTAMHECDTRGFARKALQARAVVSEYWHSADGNPDNGTIHVEIHLRVGRTKELLAQTAESIINFCQSAARGYAEKPLSISVEFVEMPDGHYTVRRVPA